jgi:hypothetical protein
MSPPDAPDTAPLVARLRELMAKATPGPFVVERDDQEDGTISYGVWCHAKDHYCEVASFSTFTNKNAKRDAELYAAMHEALPALLAGDSRWLPIESAPRDRPVLFLSRWRRTYRVQWHTEERAGIIIVPGRWVDLDTGYPLHLRIEAFDLWTDIPPLPAPPAPVRGEDGGV